MAHRQQEAFSYGRPTQLINNMIRDGEAPPLRNNQAVRNFAEGQYQQQGFTPSEVQDRMDKRDAGHIISKDHGGVNANHNYMWEDRSANRRHQADTVRGSVLHRAGRL